MFLETFWIEAVGTLQGTIGFGMSEVNSAVLDVHSMTSSFVSLENSETVFVHGDSFVGGVICRDTVC